MRDFCKISSLFWTGKTGKALRGKPDLQVVAMYLMTSPHSNMIGVYQLPLMYLMHETGMTMEGACKALRSLEEAEFCTFEEATETIWVHEMAKYQVGEKLTANDKRCKGVQNDLSRVQSDALRSKFIDRYFEDFNLVKEVKSSKPLVSPLEAPSKDGKTPSKQEKRKEEEIEGEREREKNPPTPKGGDALFDRFYKAYPNKKAPDSARKAFDKRKPTEALVDEMVKAINRQRQSPEWQKDGGKYIPHPATWLNQGRWMDGEATGGAQDWYVDAGFEFEWQAHNADCHPHNAHLFRDGKRFLEAA